MRGRNDPLDEVIPAGGILQGKRSKQQECTTMKEKREKEQLFTAAAICEKVVNTARLLLPVSVSLSLVATHRKAMKTEVTSNFIILQESVKASEASLVCAGYVQTNSAGL